MDSAASLMWTSVSLRRHVPWGHPALTMNLDSDVWMVSTYYNELLSVFGNSDCVIGFNVFNVYCQVNADKLSWVVV